MPELAQRFSSNPLISPKDVRPSAPGLEVECVLNPGVFRYNGQTGLVLRVAERPPETERAIKVPVLNPAAPDGIEILSFAKDDPELDLSDPRLFSYQGRTYLTTVSHLRLAWSDNGTDFAIDERATLTGEGPLESFGIEDCRVSAVADEYVLTYAAVSPHGVGVNMIRTSDWKQFQREGMIFAPENKNTAVFEETIGGRYWAFHRPSNVNFKGNHIWVASSPDLTHWGGHACIAMVRPGQWDETRMGAAAAPVRTEHGWLALYHGADRHNRYCLGALLLDYGDPTRVLARSTDPIMEPTASYEREGFFGGVVFANGHVLDGDTLTIYYGAADTVVCGASFSVREILASLGR